MDDPSFQGVNGLFVLSFQNNAHRTRNTDVFMKAKIKVNVIIDGRNVFDQPIKIIQEHMQTLEKLLLVKEMITMLGVYLNIYIL